jgi:hypothetical protein
MFDVKLYTSQFKVEWDGFIDQSKNGTFLFKRNYMEYHSDRFIDCSLMIYKKSKLSALFPANITDDTIYSHQGLTYGGLIYDKKLSAVDVLNVFEVIINHYRNNNNVKNIVYKSIPYIYHSYTSQEDLYALFRNNTTLIGCNISSVIVQKDRMKFSELRRRCIKKAKKCGMCCVKSDDFESFWNILTANLGTKYDVKPVHSLQEIKRLHNLFSENIKLYVAEKQGNIFAGVVLYINRNVVHVQYISANLDGKEWGALDILFDYLINNEYKDYEYFDFGQSTEQMGNYLNESLLFQKEGFGGRGVVYNIYRIKI